MMTFNRKWSVEYLKRCPKCGRDSLIKDRPRGELLCSNCGYIIRENEIDTRPEWRAYTKEERNEKARVGMPLSLALHDKGLATKLGPGKKDASGRPFKPSEKARVQRMKMWDRRSQMQEHFHRNLLQAFSDLDKIVDKLKVSSNVVERAAYIYRKALKKNLVRGRSILSIITASLYAACRETDTPRTLMDVAKASGIKRKNVARSYRLLHRELNLKMPVLDPVKCISKIASKTGIPEKTSREALKILNRAKGAGLSAGKDPMGLAGSALYIACVIDERAITQKDIAKASGVTEVTIRNRYKSLRKIIKFK